jgi:hypothetical protein
MTSAHAGPIETATAELLSFVEGACAATVRVGVPEEAAEPGLWLWPYELRALRQTTGTGPRHPYRFAVRYLVAGSGTAALGLLDRVLTAAVRAGEPELSLEQPDPGLWRALGLAPRPVLGFQMPATVSHEAPDTPLVRGPLVLRHLAMRPLAGTVRGPGDQPVAGLRVEVAGTPLAAYTDRDGRFGFAAIPGGDRIDLRLSGRGRTFTATVERTGDEPVSVRCDFTDTTPAGEPSGA